MRSYYIIVKSELICVISSVNSHMWDRISVPYAVRMCKTERMRSHGFKEKNVLKRFGKGKIVIANHLYEVVEGFLAK